MDKSASRVVKADQVRMQGAFHLDIGQPSKRPAAAAAGAVQPQARILENHPDHAIIEVTCGCGARTRVRCEYPRAETN